MTTFHVAELRDDQGIYCNLWQGDSPTEDTLTATYADLGQAAWAIAQHEAKTGEPATDITVYGDDDELARFNRAMKSARNYFSYLARAARAPRDKLSGRPLFCRGL